MRLGHVLLSTACVLASLAAAAEIVITSPTNGAEVCQFNRIQRQFVNESRQERDRYFSDAAKARGLREYGSFPHPVGIAWRGAEGPCTVTVKRLPDGKVFFTTAATNGSAQVDSLEIAREWEVSVTDGKTTATGVFRTEDKAPRLVKLCPKIENGRDIGGRRGLDGRRIRQGLVFRTSGLNENAPRDFYSKDEILKLYAEGRLAAKGDVGKKLEARLKKGEALSDDASKNGLVKGWQKKPGAARMSQAERQAVLSRWGFRSDIDLRSNVECFGMTGSPLGDGVTWFHYSYAAYDIEKKECNEKVFKVFLDPKNYPIVFHCIGGADRTGTVAVLLEALLGVSEDDLWMDYLTTGLARRGSVATPRHKVKITRVFDDLRKYPGETWAERAEGYFKTIGYTDKDIAFLREFLLETK